jgi:hypothetical protein
MSFLHSRCESLEATLRARCGDLEGQVDGLRDQMRELLAASAEREKELLDRILAVTNPSALLASRSSSPTPPLPSLERQQVRRMPTGMRPAMGRATGPILMPPEPPPSKE